MQQCAHAWFISVDVVEGAHEKLVKLRLGVFRLDGRFGDLAAIGGKQRAAVTFPEPFAPVVNHHFAQRVQLAFARRLVADFAAEKKIESSREGAARAARAFGYGFDQPVCFREPVNDQAGFGESREADGDGPCWVHALRIGNARGPDDAKARRIQPCGAL